MRDYAVTITETLEMTVFKEAESLADAEAIVKANWKEGEYILDADHFVGVSFKAKPVAE